MNPRTHDIAAYSTPRYALARKVITAGSTADGDEQSGVAIDRLATTLTAIPMSGQVVLPYTASLAAGQTATVKSNMQDSTASGSGWADYDLTDGSTANSQTIGSTGSTAAQSLTGALNFAVDLDGAKQYVRLQTTVTITSTATDTVDLGIVTINLGGSHDLPQT